MSSALYVILGLVVVVGVLFVLLRRGGGGAGGFAPGTLAWEASMELPLLDNLIQVRTSEMPAADAKRKERLQREVDFLEAQRQPLMEVIAKSRQGDRAPGKGYIGVKQLPADE